MTAPVYTKTLFELPEAEYVNKPTKTVIKRQAHIFAEDKKVCLKLSERVSGINKHSGKRWYRWETSEGMGIYLNHNGTPIPYAYTYTPKRNRIFTSVENLFRILAKEEHWLFSAYDGEVENEFRSITKDKLGISSLSDIYPIAGMHDLDYYNFLQLFPSKVRGICRTNNYREFVGGIFGEDKVRKDLVKACAVSNVYSIFFACELAKYIPIDWVVGFLNNYGQRFDRRPTNWYLRYLGDFFDAAGETTVKNLTLKYNDGNTNYLDIVDSLRMFAVVEDRHNRATELLSQRNFRSWHQIHEALIELHRQPVKEEVFEIGLTELAQSLQGLNVDDLSIKMADNTKIMHEWSNYMSNCIKSYARQAVDQTGEYGAVYQNDQQIANFEIKSNEVKQLLGKHNRNLDKDVRHKIEAMLESVGVKTQVNYWGRPEDERIAHNVIRYNDVNLRINGQWQNVGWVRQNNLVLDEDNANDVALAVQNNEIFW